MMDRAILHRLQRLEDYRDELRAPADGLTASLWEYGATLAAMDALERTITAEALGIAPDAVKTMARSYTRTIKI